MYRLRTLNTNRDTDTQRDKQTPKHRDTEAHRQRRTHYAAAKRTEQDSARAAAQAKRVNGCGAAALREVRTEPAQESGWAQTSHPIAAGKDGGRPLQEWQRFWSVTLARSTAATILTASGTEQGPDAWTVGRQYPCSFAEQYTTTLRRPRQRQTPTQRRADRGRQTKRQTDTVTAADTGTNQTCRQPAIDCIKSRSTRRAS